MPELRAYQSEAIERVVAHWNGGLQRPIIVMATGTGKTVVMAKIVAEAQEMGYRPLILVHRDELVSQTVEKLVAACDECLIGVIQAERHEVDADIVVASVQTLTRRLGRSARAVAPDRFNLIVTDECHHSAAPSYLAIYDWFGGRTDGSGTRMLGVTATPKRLDGVQLGHVWDAPVAYAYDTATAISEDYLVRPVGKRVGLAELDGKIKIKHGDFSESDLGAKMMRSGHRIGEAVLAHGRREDGALRRGITFAPTVACAQSWADEFNQMGIVSKVVVGATPRAERHDAYARLRDGRIDMLVSVMVLTEGFDLPAVELAVIGRPTKNESLYVQMVGRVLRPSDHTGKQDALVLDVCGAIGRPIALDIDCLGLPDSCECGSDVAFRYLCAPRCECPTEQGEHNPGCQYLCRQFGESFEPGEKDDDEIDDSSIEVVEVDIFALPKSYIAKRAVKWLQTNNQSGTRYYFLPGSVPRDQPTVFLVPTTDGSNTWQVGSYLQHGKPKKHGDPVAFPLAVEAGLRIWGPKPRPLTDVASVAQMTMLHQYGYTLGRELSKQEASDLISIELTTRRLNLV